MAMCIHGWQFETCKFGCTLRKKEELKLANDELQAENEKLKEAYGILEDSIDEDHQHDAEDCTGDCPLCEAEQALNQKEAKDGQEK